MVPPPECAALYLILPREYGNEADLGPSDMSAFAKLHGLTQLTLRLGVAHRLTLADVVGALVPLTGLMELNLHFPQAAVVPSALGRLKGLQSLFLWETCPCSFEAGCLDLPNLRSLEFRCCYFELAEVLPNIGALQRLTRIQFLGGLGPQFFDHQLVQLPKLQHMVFQRGGPHDVGACHWLFELPADMGLLRSGLLHLDFSGHRLSEFPCALTQLAALECLNADGNEFADLPTGITALSRLRELFLGRVLSREDPAQLRVKRTLDVRALGDLSAFPALSELKFSFCEVLLCDTLLGAVRHPNLASLSLHYAHPAPRCTLMVLQLSQSFRDLRRGNVLKFVEQSSEESSVIDDALRKAQGRAPFQSFRAAMAACGL